MKGKDIVIGQVYLAKVSGKLARVKIVAERMAFGSGNHCSHRTYWIGRNEKTGREITIHGAARLRPMPVSFTAARVDYINGDDR